MAVEHREHISITESHRQAIQSPISELASTLQTALSRRLTAYITGVSDAKTVTRWANGEVAEIRDYAVEQRLRTAYEIHTLLMNYESAPTVKAWFIGLNPQLDDISPAQALHDGRLAEAMSAARAFTIGG